MRQLILILALAGCQPAPREKSFTAEQQEARLKGMTPEEVKRLLGPPSSVRRDGSWLYDRGRWDPVTERRAGLFVEFERGRVTKARP